jgi:hypothetical protein
VKIEEAEDGSTCDVSAVGSKEELERFCEVPLPQVLILKIPNQRCVPFRFRIER